MTRAGLAKVDWRSFSWVSLASRSKQPNLFQTTTASRGLAVVVLSASISVTIGTKVRFLQYCRAR